MKLNDENIEVLEKLSNVYYFLKDVDWIGLYKKLFFGVFLLGMTMTIIALILYAISAIFGAIIYLSSDSNPLIFTAANGILLGAVIILLVSGLFWAIFKHIEEEKEEKNRNRW